MMRHKFALGLCLMLALAACATPRERCLARQTRDLRTVDALIAETRANMARGYALRAEARVRPRLTFCTGHHHRHVGLSFCTGNELVARDVPVAIDPEAERRKLAALETRRRDLAIAAQAAAASCGT